MKTKVAIVIPSLRGGGAERVMVNVIRHLDLDKFDIKLIVVNKEGPYAQHLPENIDVVDLNSDRVRYAFLKLIKELNNYQPDVVLSTLGHLNLILLSIKRFLKSSPIIIVREANTPSKSLTRLSIVRKLFFKCLYRMLYPTANAIIAQCQDMKQDIVETFKIDENKVIYIYNPIDIKTIIKESTKFNPYKDDEINIVAVGRLTFQKGFDILIDAFKIVNQKIPNTKLTILGDGELKFALTEQVKKVNLTDSVAIIGFRNNPYPYYNYADLYVLSSRWEGFPNTLLEALACGVKVVATNCKSGPREILGDNEYGTLVDVADVTALAEGMINSIKSNNKTGKRAMNYNISTIINQYTKILLGNMKL